MRVLIDIVHPAHVLFFLNPIRILQERGDEILILSRHKDVACALLDAHRLDHTPVSTALKGLPGLALELAWRDLAVARHALRFRPDVMVGFGGVAVSHVGALLRIPSVSFYDTETATLQNRITWPFIGHLYVPQSYSGPVPEGRTTRFAGGKELCFLHPDNFSPDRETALASGLDPDRPNYLIRTVKWNANHDRGKTGWREADLVALCDLLAARGRVHISSERDLPARFEAYRYRAKPDAMHHLMAFCDLYVGESASMGHESAFVGTPAIYDGADHPATTRELARCGLLTALSQQGWGPLRDAVERALSTPRTVHGERLAAYLNGKPNLASYVVEALDWTSRGRIPAFASRWHRTSLRMPEPHDQS
ncbi:MULTISPECIES: DUF354 domain-containing protein [unclassified Roseitalea]|uniref:DUF354 domain-containing protein n=1 Tax=unclassified Roseitalea TaxID=2639107 RepID=UPI00273E1BED|nr:MULTISPECIES: DUF354 domain-containing protein [unclassified Roseitalea]